MFKLLSYCFIAFIALRCSGSPSPALPIEKTYKPVQHRGKFLYNNLQAFSIDAFEWGTHGKHYPQLDSAAWLQLWQDSVPYSSWDPCYYFAAFSDSSRITLLQENESWNSVIIWLLQYDGQGKLRSKTPLAYAGGDGGDAWSVYGQFQSDKTYQRTEVFESYFDPSGDSLVSEMVRWDSAVLRLAFLPDYRVQVDTVGAVHRRREE
ncbi:MAG: hypothetical protein IT260_01465 [Saprospiraceae bacterium]|nr:hypothetical protein [Saprospiraceae bacterium]